ncbi:MAG: Pyridinium-3,5-bisthiocarboxylic acid mononucleotide nickel insertion protein [Nitrosopumilales archaeon]|nr:MAG: Pyridinium-3,5-bisthiocarboxylic acid mononucleotide nickel insertion protein [Nitrosopumilales archaeon]
MVVVIDPQIAGISGDMLLSSLVNLGADKSKIIEGVKTAEKFLENSEIKKIDFETVKKHGTESTTLVLEVEEKIHERKGIEIKKCIQNSLEKLNLSEKAKNFALSSIDTLLVAESKIHGYPIESVHFHEASSIDTVVDIIGSAIALDDLKFFDDQIVTAPVAVGGGTITFSHGTTSNPASAILEIFKNSNITISGGNVKEELTTPTGASLLVSLTNECSEFYPALKIKSIGYGSGKKDFEGFSNVLKIVQGEKVDNLIRDSVKVLETNIDDVSGELLGNLIEKIMSNGAKDVTISSAITKKGRPTNLVSVICDSNTVQALLNLLIQETGTLGVRISTSERFIVPRSVKSIPVNIEGQNFTVHYKTANNNLKNFKLEFEDVKQISNSLNKSFRETGELIKSQVRKKLDST